MTNLLLAPDKFKGSLSASEICQIMQSEIEKVNPLLQFTVRPMADGGDGSLALLRESLNLHQVDLEVVDPLMRNISAYYFHDDKTAYIELAIASGHARLSKSELNPMQTSTYGTGLLIRHAIYQGFEEIYLFLGGSSTNDAGIGILDALGIDFYDQADRLCPPVGSSLSKINRIDASRMVDFSSTRLIVVTDVKNSMYGPDGAAYIYARQKGASEDEVAILDEGLRNFASVVEAKTGKQISEVEGGGAAGGIAAGLYGFLPIVIRRGFAEMSRLLGLEPLIENCDMVLTGEGKLDQQTASGKVISGICELARKYNKPTYVFVGQNAISEEEQNKLGITKAYALMDVATTESDAMKKPDIYLRAILHTFAVEKLK